MYRLYIMCSLFLLGSCANEKKEVSPQASTCNTTALGYTAVIKPILQSNCIRCHQSTTPILDTDINIVKAFTITGSKMMCSIKQSSGCSPMPKGGKLSDCDIQKLDKWLQSGASILN